MTARSGPWRSSSAGHFDISIGLTVMLMAEPQHGQVGRDPIATPEGAASGRASIPTRGCP
ncbi:MAG TPA: hypothetical protein VFX88_16655 [Actinomycetota bacterium]|jgi:hypothetical protein|nr:hypothetical protein [Actinomycetota bacterium]